VAIWLGLPYQADASWGVLLLFAPDLSAAVLVVAGLFLLTGLVRVVIAGLSPSRQRPPRVSGMNPHVDRRSAEFERLKASLTASFDSLMGRKSARTRWGFGGPMEFRSTTCGRLYGTRNPHVQRSRSN